MPKSIGHETAFTEIKRIIAKETLLAYPNFSKTFIKHSDASDFQLGAVIMQVDNGGVLRPLAFYTRKLNSAQKNYTTTEKELLSIVETLNEFCNILLGYEIDVYTDHKNLTFATDENSSQRRKRWESLVQEFGINIIHITGNDNIVADALSRLPKYEDLPKDEKLKRIKDADVQQANVRQLDGKVIPQEIQLLAMAFIDPATGWFEWAEVKNDKSSAHISQLQDSVWLARFPRPKQVLYGNGSEFKKDFQPLLKDLAIKPKCTTIKNPQANSILERIHQVTGNMLTLSDLSNQEFDIRTCGLLR